MNTVYIIMCDLHTMPCVSTNDIVFFWHSKDYVQAQNLVGCQKKPHAVQKDSFASKKYSVSAWLTEHLVDIRQELAALMYDVAVTPVQGKTVHEHLQAGDSLSMWWCSLLFEKHPHLLPELYTVFKLRAAECMLEAYAPTCTQLVLHGGDALLRKTWQDFCHTTGKTFIYHTTSFDTPLKKSQYGRRTRWIQWCYWALPSFVRASLRFVHWCWQVKRLLPHTHMPRPTESGITMVTYFPHIDMQAAQKGIFRSRYWESLHQLLSAPLRQTCGQDIAVHWLFIRIHTARYSLKKCIALRDVFRATKRDGASFHYAEEFLQWKDVGKACVRYVRLAYISRCLMPHVSSLFCLGKGHMPVWAYMKKYWQESFAGWRCLERCLQRQALRQYVAWVGAQRGTFFPMEHCPWERMLTEAVHSAVHRSVVNTVQQDFTTYGLVHGVQHSTVRPTDFRYFDDSRLFIHPIGQTFLPDIFHVNGMGAWQCLYKAGVPTHKLSLVEALRYVYLAHAVQQSKAHITHVQAMSMPYKKQLCRPYRIYVLVCTSFFVEETDAHIRLLAQCLQAEQCSGIQWRIEIKAHPHLPVESYLDKYFPPHLCSYVRPCVLKENIEDILQKFVTPATEKHDSKEEQRVVWVSNSTSVVLEAALRALPILVQCPQDTFDLCPLQSVKKMANMRYVATVDDVCKAVHFFRSLSIFSIPKEYFILDALLPRWKNVLRHYISNNTCTKV